MLRRAHSAFAVSLLLFACNRVTSDNFDRTGEPLRLQPAPGGLCGGDGAQKDCSNPAGCQASPPPANAAPPVVNPANAASPAPAGDIFTDNPAAQPLPIGYPAEPGLVATSSPPGVAGQPAVLDPMPTPTVPMTVFDAGPPLLSPADGGTASNPARVDAGGGDPTVDAGNVPSRADAGRTLATDAGALSRPDAALSFGQIGSELQSGCGGIQQNHTATLYLSADDSNSMASPVIARRLIRLGLTVPPAIVRPYEFLNYYDFAFEPAKHEEVRIVPQLSSCPVDGELNLQIALQSERRDPDDRKPLNVTFVLDTSGSMAGVPLALQRAAVHAMARRMRAGDVVSMVTWNVDQRVQLSGHAVVGPNDASLLAAVDALTADGGTDLSGGLRAGYALAEMHRASDRINRLVVVSDGIANVGITDAELIGAYANDEEGEEGIYLAGVGVGDGVNDTLMNTVTDAGRGAYVYLDSVEEADRMLDARFLEVVDVAARSVRLELTLPWYMQVAKFYGEQISTDRTKVRPQHLGPNSAMVFFQVLKACDAALIHGNDRLLARATWSTPFTREKKTATIDTTFNALAGDDRDIEKAAVIAGYAEALQLAGAPGLAPGAARALLDQALAHVVAAPAADSDPDLVEVRELLTSYSSRFAPAP